MAAEFVGPPPPHRRGALQAKQNGHFAALGSAVDTSSMPRTSFRTLHATVNCRSSCWRGKQADHRAGACRQAACPPLGAYVSRTSIHRVLSDTPSTSAKRSRLTVESRQVLNDAHHRILRCYKSPRKNRLRKPQKSMAGSPRSGPPQQVCLPGTSPPLHHLICS
jgi:hypothetical protein